jgi:hypothetical protein
LSDDAIKSRVESVRIRLEVAERVDRGKGVRVRSQRGAGDPWLTTERR